MQWAREEGAREEGAGEEGAGRCRRQAAALRQALPGRGDGEAFLVAGHRRCGGGGVRVEKVELLGIVEQGAAVGVGEAFDRGAFGQDQRVAVEFDVQVGGGAAFVLGDGAAIDQGGGGDQQGGFGVIEPDGVLRGEVEVAGWHAVGQGARADAHGAELDVAGHCRRVVVAPADPADGGSGAGGGQDQVADAQGLDGAGACRRGDGGAGDETCCCRLGYALCRRVAEDHEFDVCQRVGAVGADELIGGAAEEADRMAGGDAAEDGGVAAGATGQQVVAEVAAQGVVAEAAGQGVGGAVAAQGVVAGAAGGIFDQRAGVGVEVEMGVGDVAVGEVAAAEIGQLCRTEEGPFARAQIDRQCGGVVRQVIGVGAVAVPDRGIGGVGCCGTLGDAVDGHFAGEWAPGVGGIAGADVEVGAVDVLQCGDIVDHVGLIAAAGGVFVGVTRGADI